MVMFTDTDSLAYKVMTDDFFADISNDVFELFDTSNFVSGRPLAVSKNKKVVGMFQDGAGGKIIVEFVGPRAKLYSYRIYDPEGEGKEEKKSKGIKKAVMKKSITHEDYKRCLFSGTDQLRQMRIFRSRKHEVYTEAINKIALSSKDDRRIVLPNNSILWLMGVLAKNHRENNLGRHNR